MAPNRPQLWWQVAWQAEPNDPLAMRRWTDLTHMVRKVRQVGRGRQYELAKSLAGEPPIVFRDPDEYLNPANTASPYYPHVQPYREFLGQCMWDNGGTGNLINPDMWMPNDVAPLDPSFESYSNGAAAPETITALGSVTATVTTTNPQQGTKSLTYTVAATATRQGISWQVPTVPGQQYTTSAYVRQSSASTQWLLVDDQNLSYNDFSTPASNGWGNDGFGNPYTTAGGSAANYSVSGGTGRHSIASVNVRRFTVVGSGIVDFDHTVTVTAPAVITGGGSDQTRMGPVGRYTDTANHYFACVRFRTDQTMQLVIERRVADVVTNLATVALSGTYEAGTQMRVRFQVTGSSLNASAWYTTRRPPTEWDASVTDTALSAGGAVGYTSFATSGVTNTLPMVAAFDDAAVIGSTASATTTTTGAYVRLSKTFTATGPEHTISVCTQGTAVAGTVNVDAIQHEPGASASAFTTSGPCIYPILRDGVERWPRSNMENTAGYVGQCDTRAVDGFAALNAITLDPDYVAAVMALDPDYFWRLDGGSGSSAAQETSGNQGPPLVPYDSKFGPGIQPEFGTPIAITGAYGGTGVRFTPTDAAEGFIADTILATGRVPGTPPILFPTAFTSTWSASIAAWVSCTDPDPALGMIVAFPLALTSPLPAVPIYLAVFGDGTAGASLQSKDGLGFLLAASSAVVDDGTPHLIVGTVTQVNGGDTTMNIYVDGNLEDTQAVTTASLGGLFANLCTVMNVGGAGINGGRMVNGVVAQVALWDRALSADEIDGLWAAGGLGHAGELTGTRLARRLAAGGFTSATRISTGSTTMQPSTSHTIDALSDAQNITTAEDGTLWVAPDGALVFEGRQERWLRLTPRGVFGEDSSGGEIPYLDGVVFDYDPTFVYANVRVSRVNGTVAAGGSQADILTAARRYYPRSSPPDTQDYETDAIAQNKADWVFNSHKAPLLRVSQLTIDPSSNPALWKKALGIEVGQRWTVKRRAKAANAGAGLTQSEDFFIERVVHNEIDMETGRWTISFLMSPIGSITNSPFVTLQPWILEHSTYGVLDSTTVLGW